MEAYKFILIVLAVVVGIVATHFYGKHLREEGYEDRDIYLHIFRDVPLWCLRPGRGSDEIYSGSPYKKRKPEHETVDYDSYPSYYAAGCDPKVAALMNAPPVDLAHNERLLKAGGWQCACGRVNASYVASCSCGSSKYGEKEPEPVQPCEAASEEGEVQNAHAIREYKKLMDDGIITAEEFEAKKEQLLGL